jgi:hypothetical protein
VEVTITPPHDDFPALPDDADGMHLDELAVPLLVLVAVADLWMLEDRPPRSGRSSRSSV